MNSVDKTKKSLPFLVIVMGVSGCGKTTIAQQLAALNVLEFMEADEFHTVTAIEKMSNGVPLSDKDREPWIDSMCTHLKTRAKKSINCCLAYSGLRRDHRKRFTKLGFQVVFLHLIADRKVILRHLESRSDHFMGSELLESQLDDLQAASGEEPVFEVSIKNTVEETVMSAQKCLVEEIFNDRFE